jgi:hypothetical protein
MISKPMSDRPVKSRYDHWHRDQKFLIRKEFRRGQVSISLSRPPRGDVRGFGRQRFFILSCQGPVPVIVISIRFRPIRRIARQSDPKRRRLSLQNVIESVLPDRFNEPAIDKT